MKKKFTMKVMYGDADRYETFTYITEDKDEIEFLNYFLENYDEDLYLLYERPDLAALGYLGCGLDDLVDVINKLAELGTKINVKHGYDPLEPYVRRKESKKAKAEKMNELLENIITCIIFGHFDLDMYDTVMDCIGQLCECQVEDITGCMVMKKDDVIRLVKKKLGIDIVIVD